MKERVPLVAGLVPGRFAALSGSEALDLEPSAADPFPDREVRRKARSDRRARQHQARIGGSPSPEPVSSPQALALSGAHVSLPPDSIVESVTLRPKVAQALDVEAARIGVTRACYARLILEELAAKIDGRPSAPDFAVSDTEVRIPEGYVLGPAHPAVGSAGGYSGDDRDSAQDAPGAVSPRPALWPGLLPPRLADLLGDIAARLASPGALRPVVAGVMLGFILLMLIGAWGIFSATRYEVSSSAPGTMFLLDTWTGRVWNCSTDQVASPAPVCRPILVRGLDDSTLPSMRLGDVD